MRRDFFKNCTLANRGPTPISCAQTKHRFCTACPQARAPGATLRWVRARLRTRAALRAPHLPGPLPCDEAAALETAPPAPHILCNRARLALLFSTFQQETNYDHRSLRAVGALEPLTAAVRSRRGREC